MSPLVWLGIALAAGAAAGVLALPAWRSTRARGEGNEKAERYRAWRHGGRGGGSPSGESGMTAGERRRLAAGAGLGAVAAVALVAFFVTS